MGWIEPIFKILNFILKNIVFPFAKRKSEEIFKSILEGTIAIQDLINKYIVKLEADRVIVIKMENGGGIPTIGNTISISVMFEATGTDTQPIKDQYQQYTVDVAYQKLIKKVMDNDVIFIEDAQNINVPFLAESFKYRDIRQVVLSYVTTIPKQQVVFLSLQWKSDKSIQDQITLIRELTSSIRNIYEDVKRKEKMIL